MSQYLDYIPSPDIFSAGERLRAAREAAREEQPGATFSDVAAAAIRQEWSLVNLWDTVTRTGSFDPNYRIDDAEFTRLTKDVPEQYHTAFAMSRSQEEADAIRQRVLQEVSDQQT